MATINDILNFLDNRKVIKSSFFDNTFRINRAFSILGSKPGDICFLGKTAKNPKELSSKINASLVIIDQNLKFDYNILLGKNVQAIIISKNARLDFINIIDNFFYPPKKYGIHHSSIINSASHIHDDVFIGPLCSIGANVDINSGTYINSGVHIYDNVKIGNNVIIHSGTVIGSDGFGYEKNDHGELIKFPHIGGVIIEDDVEIGSNSCIDRGTLGNTVIGKGVRIDNLVHISHNVSIGKHSVVIAHAMVGGGIQIGDHSWISPCSCLRDRIAIGRNVTIGLGSVVTKSISDDMTYFGSPARELSDQLKLLTHLKEEICKK